MTLYNYAWSKASKAYLKANPLCVRCQGMNRLRLATVVDHIEPHRGDKSKFWDRDNWQGLCKRCHDKKTASEDGGFGNSPTDKPTGSCNLDGIPTDSRHHWNK